jgi:hypothetical protein
MLVLLGCCALAPLAARADAPPPPAVAAPDAEFLEFLGNGDDADADLKQYLAQRDAAARADDAKAAPKRGSEKP